MSTALRIVAEEGVLDLSDFEFNTWLHRGAPIVERHRRLCKEKDKAQWAIGDWLLEFWRPLRNPNYRGEYPELHQNSYHNTNTINMSSVGVDVDPLVYAANYFGYAVGTFQEFRRIARVFPTAADRVPGLSWKHHQAVAAITVEQERTLWLFSAKTQGWSKTKLQAQIAACREAGTSLPLPSAQPRAYPVGPLTKDQEQTLASLAKQTGLGVSQVKDLIVSNFLDEPAKVQEFSEVYTPTCSTTA